MNETVILERIDWIYGVYYTQKYFVVKIESLLLLVGVVVYLLGFMYITKRHFKQSEEYYTFEDKMFITTIIALLWFFVVLVIMLILAELVYRFYLLDLAREYYTVKWILNDIS